jgi:hypothetical protein
MSTLAPLAQRALDHHIKPAWDWWTSELAAMLPDRLRTAANGLHATITLAPTSVEIDRVVDGVGERLAESRPIDEFDDAAWAELASLTSDCNTRVLLQPPACHSVTVTLPKVARGRLRSAIALQLSQIAPINPDQLTWVVDEMAADDAILTVRVTMARTSHMAQLQRLFVDNGHPMPPIDAASDGARVALAKGCARARSPKQRQLRQVAAITVLMLVSIPLTTLIGAAVIGAATQNQIAALETKLAPKMETERRLRRAEALRAAFAPLIVKPDASSAIEELASLLPETAYAQSVEQGLDRSLMVTASAINPDETSQAISGSDRLAQMEILDQTTSADGRVATTFRSRPR